MPLLIVHQNVGRHDLECGLLYVNTWWHVSRYSGFWPLCTPYIPGFKAEEVEEVEEVREVQHLSIRRVNLSTLVFRVLCRWYTSQPDGKPSAQALPNQQRMSDEGSGRMW